MRVGRPTDTTEATLSARFSLPRLCCAHYIPAKAGLELGSYHRSSKEEVLVPTSSFNPGYPKGLRGHSPKGEIGVLSEADVFRLRFTVDYLCELGQVTACFPICSTIWWGRVGVSYVAPGSSFEGLT